MTPSLDPALESALRELARVPTLLVALDFDGVLAPIVEQPDQARPLPDSLSALRRLVGAQGLHVALVSGRSLSDLRTAHEGFFPDLMRGELAA